MPYKILIGKIRKLQAETGTGGEYKTISESKFFCSRKYHLVRYTHFKITCALRWTSILLLL